MFRAAREFLVVRRKPLSPKALARGSAPHMIPSAMKAAIAKHESLSIVKIRNY